MLIVGPAVHNVVHICFINDIFCLFRVLKIFRVDVAVYCFLSLEQIKEQRRVRLKFNTVLVSFRIFAEPLKMSEFI